MLLSLLFFVWLVKEKGPREKVERKEGSDDDVQRKSRPKHELLSSNLRSWTSLRRLDDVPRQTKRAPQSALVSHIC